MKTISLDGFRYQYALVKYVPDTLRGEFAIIGFVIVSDDKEGLLDLFLFDDNPLADFMSTGRKDELRRCFFELGRIVGRAMKRKSENPMFSYVKWLETVKERNESSILQFSEPCAGRSESALEAKKELIAVYDPVSGQPVSKDSEITLKDIFA